MDGWMYGMGWDGMDGVPFSSSPLEVRTYSIGLLSARLKLNDLCSVLITGDWVEYAGNTLPNDREAS